MKNPRRFALSAESRESARVGPGINFDMLLLGCDAFYRHDTASALIEDLDLSEVAMNMLTVGCRGGPTSCFQLLCLAPSVRRGPALSSGESHALFERIGFAKPSINPDQHSVARGACGPGQGRPGAAMPRRLHAPGAGSWSGAENVQRPNSTSTSILSWRPSA